MRIDANEFGRAMTKVSALANLDKKQPGILLNISDGSVEVYYNSLQKAISIKLDAVTEESEIGRKVVFDYKRLEDTMKNCVDSGKLTVEYLDIQFVKEHGDNQPEVAIIYVVKYVTINTGEEEVKQKASENHYKIPITNIDKLTVSQRVLAVPCCEDMYPAEGADGISIEELKDTVNIASSNDAKVIYFSHKQKGVFASNTNSCVFIKSDGEMNKTWTLSRDVAKALVAIFDSVKDTDELYMNTIKVEDTVRACVFFTEDEKLSVYLSIAGVVNAHVTSMMRYLDYEYNGYHIDIMTEPLKDVVKSANSLNGGIKGNVKVCFDEETNSPIVECRAENSGKSVSNIYKVDCRLKTMTPTESIDSSEVVKFSIDLGQLLGIINMCRTDYMGIDVEEVNEENLALRIGFIDMVRASQVASEFKEAKGLDYKMTNKDKMDIRSSYLKTCFYTVVSRK